MEPGVADLRAGRMTVAGLLVARATTRLRAMGVDVPDHGLAVGEPERRLYRLLEAEDEAGAYSTYNALSRRLVSYMEARERLVP